MMWAGTEIVGWLPERGRRVPMKWLPFEDSLYWNYDEDLYFDLS